MFHPCNGVQDVQPVHQSRLVVVMESTSNDTVFQSLRTHLQLPNEYLTPLKEFHSQARCRQWFSQYPAIR